MNSLTPPRHGGHRRHQGKKQLQLVSRLPQLQVAQQSKNGKKSQRAHRLMRSEMETINLDDDDPHPGKEVAIELLHNVSNECYERCKQGNECNSFAAHGRQHCADCFLEECTSLVAQHLTVQSSSTAVCTERKDNAGTCISTSWHLCESDCAIGQTTCSTCWREYAAHCVNMYLPCLVEEQHLEEISYTCGLETSKQCWTAADCPGIVNAHDCNSGKCTCDQDACAVNDRCIPKDEHVPCVADRAQAVCAGAPCYYDSSCQDGVNGCGAAGHNLCRFCGFDNYAEVACPDTRHTIVQHHSVSSGSGNGTRTGTSTGTSTGAGSGSGSGSGGGGVAVHNSHSNHIHHHNHIDGTGTRPSKFEMAMVLTNVTGSISDEADIGGPGSLEEAIAVALEIPQEQVHLKSWGIYARFPPSCPNGTMIKVLFVIQMQPQGDTRLESLAWFRHTYRYRLLHAFTHTLQHDGNDYWSGVSPAEHETDAVLDAHFKLIHDENNSLWYFHKKSGNNSGGIIGKCGFPGRIKCISEDGHSCKHLDAPADGTHEFINRVVDGSVMHHEVDCPGWQLDGVLDACALLSCEPHLTYEKHEGASCGIGGDCPATNDLNIGAEGHGFDAVTSSTLSSVCADKCSNHTHCAGFRYETGECHYLRSIRCRAEHSGTSTCYEKSSSDPFHAYHQKQCQSYRQDERDYRALEPTVDSDISCKATCAREQSCRGVFYNHSAKECHFINEKCEGDEIQPCTNCVGTTLYVKKQFDELVFEGENEGDSTNSEDEADDADGETKGDDGDSEENLSEEFLQGTKGSVNDEIGDDDGDTKEELSNNVPPWEDDTVAPTSAPTATSIAGSTASLTMLTMLSEH